MPSSDLATPADAGAVDFEFPTDRPGMVKISCRPPFGLPSSTVAVYVPVLDVLDSASQLQLEASKLSRLAYRAFANGEARQ